VGLVVKWEVVIMVNLRYNQRMKSQMIKIVVLKKYNLKVWMRMISKIRLNKKNLESVKNKDCHDNNICNLGFNTFST